MALWKEQTTPRKDGAALGVVTDVPRREVEVPSDLTYSREAARRVAPRDGTESVIGADLTIEGKIDGSGHIRIAGRFKGDVLVEGNLAIEPGAKVTGGVRANAVSIAGELEGNVLDAARVELLTSGVLVGDLKADSLTVAAGSRMRGRVEFGWNEPAGSTASAREGDLAS
ncbi:MAG TPA: polymer-forming cytoskeletal protein [Gemmatimonadaceae bacterium]|nr:polymer-forming cytoskeletal protein [Gemmatimonadaceae bacterium]